MTELEKLNKERAAQQTVNAYHRVFKSDDGKRVLADLVKVFGMDMPAFLPTAQGYETHHAAKRDGQQDIRRHIMAKLAAPMAGDANIEKPKKRKVIK